MNAKRISPNLNTDDSYDSSDWGMTGTIDLAGCNPATIRDTKMIRRFFAELVYPYECQEMRGLAVFNFYDGDKDIIGFQSHVTLEALSVAIRGDLSTNSAYIDITSRNFFDLRSVANFAQSLFGASKQFASKIVRK